MWIATAAESRELDRRAIHECGIPSQQLMRAASAAVVSCIAANAQVGARIAVCCGKGNNGGDGFLVALLAQAEGFISTCFCTAESANELKDDAREAYENASSAGVPIHFAISSKWRDLSATLAESDVVVDALLGTGSTGAPRGPTEECVIAINNAAHLVIAVDIPSGIDTDTGHGAGAFVHANCTVTFGRPKPFLFQSSGRDAAGEWSVDTIGLPEELLKSPTNMRFVDAAWANSLLPARSRNANKGASGALKILAGSPTYPGAAHLCARGALRAGAGIVALETEETVRNSVSANLPEVTFGLDRKFDAAVFGPGLTTSAVAKAQMIREFKANTSPAVIDADALNAIAQGIQPPIGDNVFTPHPGELARLLGCPTAGVELDRFTAARTGAMKFGCTLLLKGQYTLIAAPGQPLAVNSTGNSGMATGGMGDVLSGVIGTLLAQGRSSFEAAVLGAFWHGAAADLCHDEIGDIGYLAHEVADALPRARCKLVEHR